jgi:hypothetical protein
MKAGDAFQQRALVVERGLEAAVWSEIFSSASSQGLVRNRKISPSLIASIAVDTSAWPVSMIRTTSGCRARTSLRKSRPVMFGIRWSESTTSTRDCLSTLNASAGSLAVSRVYSSRRRVRRSALRTFSSSSTRRMVRWWAGSIQSVSSRPDFLISAVSVARSASSSAVQASWSAARIGSTR